MLQWVLLLITGLSCRDICAWTVYDVNRYSLTTVLLLLIGTWLLIKSRPVVFVFYWFLTTTNLFTATAAIPMMEITPMMICTSVVASFIPCLNRSCLSHR